MTSESFDREDADPARDMGEAATRHDDVPSFREDIDYDAAFAALVRQFEEGGTAEPQVEQEPSADVPGPDPTGVTWRGPTGAAEPWHEAVLDEHFEPPVPDPLPKGDLVTRLAWAAVLGGPLFLIVASVAAGQPPGWMVLLAVMAFIGGFVALVARMPAERDDGGDDGAVV